jgi:CSLREA domain-containing protein
MGSRSLGKSSSGRLRPLLLLFIAASLLMAASTSGAMTITVNTLAGDNDGVCGTDGTDPLQDCSLLEAIALANSDPTPAVIVFSVDGIIQIESSVVITTPVTLDGTSAPGGAHAVRIDASMSGGNAIVISGAGASGSEIQGLVVGQAPGPGIVIDSGAENVRVLGNFIGTNADGDNLGNAWDGVVIIGGSTHNTIGGSAPGEGNTIGLNSGSGVFVGGAGTTGNSIFGNFIGTNNAGADLGNVRDGIAIGIGASDNTIGGALPGEGNIIGFSGLAGVLLFDGVTGNEVLGNFIGTNGDGENLGNLGAGVAVVVESSTNTVGGVAFGEGNTIGFNSFGIFLGGAGTTGNRVLGNFIGTNAVGDDLGNQTDGVIISAGATDNMIGGIAPGEQNAIRFNGGSGVLVADLGTTGNAILGNAIFDNGGLGIDLSAHSTVGDGVTLNDGCGDPDTGPNGFQNFPVLLSVLVGGASTTIDYDLDTAAGEYRVEFFSVPVADPSGHGEGLTFLGAEQVSVSASCEETFQVVLPLTVATSALVTATATPVDGAQPSGFGGTSEFSAAVAGPAIPVPTLSSWALFSLMLLMLLMAMPMLLRKEAF